MFISNLQQFIQCKEDAMRKLKLTAAILTAGLAVSMLAGAASADEITFPLEETATFTGMISYPSGTEE